MNIPVILKELAKVGAVALTEESVKSFVETKIKPIFANWGKEDSRSIELEECLSEYLLRCYAKNNIITTIVFGRLQKTLEDLYIPLTLEEYRNEDIKWVIDENCYNILDSYSRILIVDMAGMGKSTIVKYFACQGINLKKSIPIVIELRKLDKNQSILEYIQKQINSLDKNIKIEEIVDILKKGDFSIFFDGYDEIANDNKSDVLEEIQEFTNKTSNTKIVITSREEEDLNSLGEFKCVNIKPLTEREAYKLIEKYDNKGEISKKLIKRLNEDSSMDVLKEFLENPLLVSLLYKTFEYKEEIPYKKIDFYEQVYDALFNAHDKTKGSAYVHEKKTKLDRYQFVQILRTFGFLCLKVDKVEYSSQLIYQLLEMSINRFSWLKISVDDFLYDITHAVPFVQKDGNEYKWVHKSFMEYFASCFICYDNKEYEEKYFNKMLSLNSGRKYENVLDFCYELDMLGFRKYVFLPYFKNFIDKYDNSYCDEYFEDIDQIYLDIAKSWIGLNKKVIIFVFHTEYFSKASNNDLIKECKNYMESINVGLFNIFELLPGIIISESYTVLDKILIEKRKELVTNKKRFLIGKTMERRINEKINSILENSNNHLKGIFSVDDDIFNPINQDKKLFCDLVSCTLNFNTDENAIYDYEKCKIIVQDIETEINNNSNNDFFDF